MAGRDRDHGGDRRPKIARAIATPEWSHLRLAVKTARDWKTPVTVFLGYRGDDGTITHRDRVMALALTYLEENECPKCGLPTWECRGLDALGAYETTEDVCHVTETVESGYRDAEKRYGGGGDGVPGHIVIGLKRSED